jgi:general secretion pathway protein H
MRPSTANSRLPHGFTLIELLVVVVVLSILVSVTLLSLNVLGRDSELTQETRRLHRLIEAAQEQAQIQARDYGLTFKPDGYIFQRHDLRRGVWYPMVGEALFRARQLPAGLRVRLTVEGRELLLDAQETPREEEEDAQEPPPQIFILANGDMTPFELTLEREGTDHSARLTAQVNGVLESRMPDELQDGA